MPVMSTDRRALIGLAHKAAVLAGLSDNDRRAVQQAVVGKQSCADMSDVELRRLLWHYKAKGIKIGVPGPKPPAGSGGARATVSQWAEIERLALAFGWLDGLQDRRLASFVGRTAGVDAVRFLTREGATHVISGLRRWQKNLEKKGKTGAGGSHAPA